MWYYRFESVQRNLKHTSNKHLLIMGWCRLEKACRNVPLLSAVELVAGRVSRTNAQVLVIKNMAVCDRDKEEKVTFMRQLKGGKDK